MSSVLCPVVWFLGFVSTQKTWPTLVFSFSSPNINSGKAFTVLSKKITQQTKNG